MIQPKLSGWVMAAAMLFSVFVAGLLGGAAVTEFRRPEPQFRDFRFGPGQDGRSGPGPEGRGGPRPDGRGRPGGPGMPGAVPLLPPGALDRLNLTEEQRASVDEVLQRRRAVTEDVLESVYPRLRAQLDSASTEIRVLLTPEQQEAFDRLREEMRQGVRRGGGSRPRG
jgi:Spy/CpxP family protein refolding chaperone